MAEFYYRGYKCCYYEYGSEDGRRVIVVPDDGQGGDSVYSMTGWMAPRFRITLVDFLGCGEADKPRGFVSDLWHDQAMQLKEMFYEAKYDHAVFIGIGNGGCRTLEEFLKEMPDVVETAIFTAKDFMLPNLDENLSSKIVLLPDSVRFRKDKELDTRILTMICMQILTGKRVLCPYCGGDMVEGHIVGGRDVPRWILGEDAIGFPDNEAGEFYLRNREPQGVLGHIKGAFHADAARKTSYVCYACRKMIADINVNLEPYMEGR